MSRLSTKQRRSTRRRRRGYKPCRLYYGTGSISILVPGAKPLYLGTVRDFACAPDRDTRPSDVIAGSCAEVSIEIESLSLGAFRSFVTALAATLDSPTGAD